MRIWNYIDFRSEISFRAIIDTPDGDQAKIVKCIAFHPNGYYLALGTTSALKLVFIMEERIFEYRDLPLKNVSILKFSRGGQYLAAAYQRSNTPHFRICVMHAHTQEKIREFLAHTAMCTDMSWSHDDSILYSCGKDGKLNLWSPLESDGKDASGKPKLREESYMEKSFSYSSLTCDKVNTVYMVGEETLKEGQAPKHVIREKTSQISQFQTYTVAQQTRMTRISYFKSARDHEAIVVGTETGRVLIYPKNLKFGDYQKLNTHIEDVTFICSDVNGRYLFTAGKDGLLNIYQVVSKIGDVIQNDAEETTTMTAETEFPKHMCVKRELADVVLFDRKEIVKYRLKLEEHKQRIEDLRAKLEHHALELKIQLEDEKKKAEERQRKESQLLNERYEQLMAQKQAVDAEHTNLLKVKIELIRPMTRTI